DVLRCTPRTFGICWPASEGWVSKVRQRLADDPTLVNIMDAGRAPLHLAAKGGHLGVVKLLIEAGANVNLRDAEGKTALDLAGERPDQAGSVKVAEWLKDRDPRGREDMAENTTMDEEETFIVAIRGGELGKVKSMLAARPGLIRSRRHGASPILIARLVVERGAPVNARQGTSGLGFTPLMEAALNGQTEMVDLLLEHGADRTMRDEKGHTAGDYARQNGHGALADHLA